MVQVTLKLSDEWIEKVDRIVLESNKSRTFGASQATRTSVLRDLLGSALTQHTTKAKGKK